MRNQPRLIATIEMEKTNFETVLSNVFDCIFKFLNTDME